MCCFKKLLVVRILSLAQVTRKGFLSLKSQFLFLRGFPPLAPIHFSIHLACELIPAAKQGFLSVPFQAACVQ